MMQNLKKLPPVLRYPETFLRKKTQSVSAVDRNIKKLIQEMFEVMYADNGIGLAANQIGENLSIFIADISDDQSQPLVFINPEITEKSEKKQTYEEGCLSVPGIFAKVERPAKITVNALDQAGKPFSLAADGLLSQCIQHELDHLAGVLFIDYLTAMKRELILKKLKKLHLTVL